MKVPYQGREVEATEIEFFTRKEEWNEYQLSDGKILKMKTVVTDVVRIDGEKTPEGDQVYSVRSANIVRVK